MGRLFGFVGMVAALAIGMYMYAKQAQAPAVAAGTNNPKAAVNITGVRTDLMSIAQAERGYYATEGKYASLDELISSHAISMSGQRPPYTYAVETSVGGFRVVAARGADDGSGLPTQMSVDQDMDFSESR